MATIAEVIGHNPTLKAHKQNYPEIERLGNAPTTKANPVTVAPQVPKQITLKAIMAIVPAAEMAKVYAMSGFVDDVRRAIDADDREYMGILIQIAAAANAISSGTNSTVSKLQALLSATEADPTWSATIDDDSIFAKAGLGYVPAVAIQASDPGAGNW